VIDKSTLNQLQWTLDYIEEHLEDVITLEMLEGVSLMSKTSFYILFSNVIGVTVKEYITKRRLNISAFKLVETDRKVIDIAFEAMYNSSEAYSRRFKKEYGVSPTEYRKIDEFSEHFPKASLIKMQTVQGDQEKGGILMNDSIKNKIVLDIEVKKTDIDETYILDVKSNQENMDIQNTEIKIKEVGKGEIVAVITV